MKRFNINLLIAVVLSVITSCSPKASKNDGDALPDVSEMISLANMSHDETIEYLTTKRNFILDKSEVVYSQRITSLKLVKSGHRTDFVKNQWQERDSIFHSIHYDIKPSIDSKPLQNEIINNGFALKEHVKDDMKESWLYLKNRYSISIYRFKPKDLPLSIELHKY